MSAVDEAGRVYRRCGCRSKVTGRQLGARCPLLSEPHHGRWYFAVQISDVDSRRMWVRRGGFASRAEAERGCWDLWQMPGPAAVARTWTVRRWLEFWLSEVEGRLRPTTVLNYRSIVNRYLLPRLGGQRLSKLRTGEIQRAMDAISHQRVRSGRLISPGTVNRIRAAQPPGHRPTRGGALLHAAGQELLPRPQRGQAGVVAAALGRVAGPPADRVAAVHSAQPHPLSRRC
ncbi:MAG TPA: N-terminal phage integrase SAM-like domain-containing protein [Micromonosporaceae bacterium]|nr:N-terminal phage integrase SAM-like domain-containing protein [Micromonosporaceae bacterium]